MCFIDLLFVSVFRDITLLDIIMCFMGFAHVTSHVLNLFFVCVPFMWFLNLKVLKC